MLGLLAENDLPHSRHLQRSNFSTVCRYISPGNDTKELQMGDNTTEVSYRAPDTQESSVDDFVRNLYSGQESWSTSVNEKSVKESGQKTNESTDQASSNNEELPTLELTGLTTDSPALEGRKSITGGVESIESDEGAQKKSASPGQNTDAVPSQSTAAAQTDSEARTPEDKNKSNPTPKPEPGPKSDSPPKPDPKSAPTKAETAPTKPGIDPMGGSSEQSKPEGGNAPGKGMEKAPPAKGGDNPPPQAGSPKESPDEASRLRGDSDLKTNFDPKKTLTDSLKAQAKAGLGLKPDASDKDLNNAINEEVKALGADTYARREQAKARLDKAGPATAEALARASVESPDAQIRMSSRQLLGRLTSNPDAVADQSFKLGEINSKAHDVGADPRKQRNDFFAQNKDVARPTPREVEGFKHVAAVLNKLGKEYAGTPNEKAIDRHKAHFAQSESERNLLPMQFGSSLAGKAYQDFRLNEPNRSPQSDAQVRDSLERAMKAYPAIAGTHTFNSLAQKLGLDKDPKFVKDYISNGGKFDDLKRSK